MEGEGQKLKEFVLPEGAIVNTDGTVHYPMRFPVSYSKGSETVVVQDVTIRRKKMADNKAIKSMINGIDIAATLIERLCEVPMVAVDRMDDIDVENIGAIIEGFSMPGPLTGNAASA